MHGKSRRRLTNSRHSWNTSAIGEISPIFTPHPALTRPSHYFPGFLVGPYLDYESYMALINETIYQDREEDKKAGRRVPKGRKRVAYWKLAKSLVFLGMFVGLGSKFTYAAALEPWFGELNIVSRFVFWVLYVYRI